MFWLHWCHWFLFWLYWCHWFLLWFYRCHWFLLWFYRCHWFLFWFCWCYHWSLLWLCKCNHKVFCVCSAILCATLNICLHCNSTRSIHTNSMTIWYFCKTSHQIPIYYKIVFAYCFDFCLTQIKVFTCLTLLCRECNVFDVWFLNSLRSCILSRLLCDSLRSHVVSCFLWSCYFWCNLLFIFTWLITLSTNTRIYCKSQLCTCFCITSNIIYTTLAKIIIIYPCYYINRSICFTNANT